MAAADVASAGTSPTTVPHRLFVDDDIYREELERLFKSGWVYVGIEAEIPSPGDFKTGMVGDLPVIVSRGKDATINVVENVCAHRGSMVVAEPRGTSNTFTCPYHQWTYASNGRLLGVPLQAQYKGRLDKECHGLRPARVDTFSGLIFASFDHDIEPLDDYLADAKPHVREMLYDGDLVVIGYHRYAIRANWKLHFENSLDPYHALLLHRFVAAMGLVPQGDNISFGNGHGVIALPMVNVTDEMREALRQKAEYIPRDNTMVQTDDRPNGSTNRILGLFPNLILLEQWDQLAIREIVPTGPGSMRIVGIALGRSSESVEKLARRARAFSHEFGPAGFVSHDDVVVSELVQRAVTDRVGENYMGLGNVSAESGDVNGEYTVRAFYKAYRDRMAGAPATMRALA